LSVLEFFGAFENGVFCTSI